MRYTALILLLMIAAPFTYAQTKVQPNDKFKQLTEDLLPPPDRSRIAPGAPGPEYWQQRADYVIDVELDDARQRINGSETITYYNQSPHTLPYLWIQLDQNIFAKGSGGILTETAPDLSRPAFNVLDRILAQREFEGGYRITSVRDPKGASLRHTIVDTMMRIDLPAPLPPGQSVSFSIDWNYNINNARRINARTGYEFFPRDGNYIYEIAQWFPRLAIYDDVNGWQVKQFLGSGEFALEFGNYTVRITTPDDHIVAATGVLQNPLEVLSPAQRSRLEQARTANSPVLIVTPDEARANESHKPTGKKTWIFKAENVRDFAFASSRKFIWDAKQHTVEGNRVLAMSFYPKEGNPLWGQYSTEAIMHTLTVYSRHSVPYPYPVAISVNGPVGGMEYPMICFNGPRPEEDGTYTANTKYALISVIIHEVGHNFFPMIVNNDERQWTWMDEGLNTFLQFIAEQQWENNYPSFRGEPKDIVDFMTSDDQTPIMTSSDSAHQFGNSQYSKVATALNILRETVLGRDLFDNAFREYSRRWKFKRPTPGDFFRSLEDASGVDLDWFWRGWFFTIDHTDISIEGVRLFSISTGDPEREKARLRREQAAQPETLARQRNKPMPKLVDQNPALKDFYNTYDPLVVTEHDRQEYQKFLATLTPHEKELLQTGLDLYVVDLKNLGGLVMPVILEITFADGTKEVLRIPAEIWRYNDKNVSKLIATPKEIASITLDPHLETADADLTNNSFPRRLLRLQSQPLKSAPPPPNPMQMLERKTGPQTSPSPTP